MKILCIDTTADGRLTATAGADSAILRHGEPVFVAEPVGQWLSKVAPSVRISRLGLNIKEANVPAHCDAFALMHILSPAANNAEVDGLPVYAFDRTFSPGDWLPLESLTGKVAVKVAVTPIATDSPLVTAAMEYAIDDLGIRRAVAQLSRHMTFKTGDVLVFLSHAVDLGAPALDTQLKAIVNGIPDLSIRIK